MDYILHTTEREQMYYSFSSLLENCVDEISVSFYPKIFPFLSYSHPQMVTEKRNVISWTTDPKHPKINEIK